MDRTSKLTAAYEEARASYAESNPKSKMAFEKAAQHLPGGSTRSSIFIHPFPLYIARGYDTRLEDVDGHVYVDM